MSNKEIVKSVGNSWIVSRSKSYPGHVFYFNTLTGESVWNLSDTEISRANQATSKKNNTGNYPEPAEPPEKLIDNFQLVQGKQQNSQGPPPSKIYNKQVINNQFPRPAFPPFVQHCNNCNTYNSIQSLGVDPSFNHMWSMPSHPILVAPTASPISNQSQTMNTTDFKQCFSVQKTHAASPRINNLRNRSHHMRKYGARKPYNRNVPRRNNLRPSYQNHSNDLREILSAKRTAHNVKIVFNDSAKDDSIGEYTKSNISDQLIKSTEEKTDLNNPDDEWLKEHGYIEGAILKLNLTPLKDLAINNADSERWYIVVDISVVLYHYNFLNVLIISDAKCQLIVTRDVMSELQATAKEGAVPLKHQARDALRFIWQQLAIECAVIGEQNEPDEMKKDGINLIEFCTKLHEQNDCVILLSNNEMLQSCERKIPIFTITQLKEFLANDSSTHKQPINTEPLYEHLIKITIPNDKIDDAVDDNQHKNLSAEDVNLQLQSHPIVDPDLPKLKETDVQTEIVTKTTIDTGVQTDFILLETQTVNETNNSRENDVIININPANEPKSDVSFNESMSDQTSTRREICLNRSTLNVTNVDNHAEKRQFKWHRRKKYISCTDAASNNANLNRNIENDMESVSTCYDDNMNSSETSSCIYMHRKSFDNIIIPESSTSDVISNSISNFDSESLQGTITYKTNIDSKSDTGQTKNVMFEITSELMEEHLKTRSDEWLSRFVQIMEEVLTQILQQESRFLHNSMPPPWTLHEATECIKQIFKNDIDINDAATKLSQILFKISDARGRIGVNVKPSEFMELYSYGVYLVDALHSFLEKCEDLQTAAESLTKLLNDIQNPNADESHNDSFAEPTVIISQSSTEGNKGNTQDDSTNNTSADSNKNSNNTVVHEESEINDKHPRKYNLRSNKTDEKESAIFDVKFVRKINVEHDFFNILKLARNEMAAKNDPGDQTANKCDVKNVNKLHPHEVNDESTSNNDRPQIVIRKFNIQPEFEERLKKPLDMDVLDYSVGYDDRNDVYDQEPMEEDYDQIAEGYDHIEEDHHLDEPYYRDNGKQNVGSKMCQKVDKQSPKKLHAYENQISFRTFIGTIMHAIKEATAKVHDFCAKTQTELSNDKDMNSVKKKSYYEKAQKTQLHIENLCDSLKRIKQREDNQSGNNNCQALLKEVGVHLDAEQMKIYKSLVDSCLVQGNTLLESVNVIIEAVS